MNPYPSRRSIARRCLLSRHENCLVGGERTGQRLGLIFLHAIRIDMPRETANFDHKIFAHQLAFKPATMDLVTAVAYSGLAAAELRRHAKEGRLVFKPLGRNGRIICPTAQIDALVAALWADGRGQPVEDLDFGDD
jgi:hypothetical protein